MKTRHHAFTLIEMLIVIGIIAMIMAIGIPVFVQEHNRSPMHKAVNDFLYSARDARAMAILRGAPVELHITTQDKTMRVTLAQVRTGNNPWATSTPAYTGPTPKMQERTIPEEISIELLDVNYQPFKDADEAVVRFYPNGTTEDFNMVLQGQNGELRRLTLDVVSGRADWEIVR